MTTLQVSFHNMIGSGIVLAPARGELFTPGQMVAVYDENTATYRAEVVEQDGDTLVLRVSDEIVADA